MRRQAVEDDRLVLGGGEQVGVDPEWGQVASAASASCSSPMLTQTSV
jgi:hypothetical protein